jgi:hypothetical protein
MLKLSHCLAFLALVTLPIFTPPASADSYCYMVKSSGQKIDLGFMCSRQTASNPSPLKTSSPRYNSSNTATSSRETYGSTKVHEGRGGKVSRGTAEDYHYQVWAKANGSGYRLVVWREQDFPNGSPLSTPREFKAVGDALNHFDCNYTNKPTPSCPGNRAS